MFESLEELLNKENCQLICSNEDGTKRRTICLVHDHNEPLESDYIILLDKRYGNVAGLVDFYRTYGDLELYIDESSGDSAFVIAEPKYWDSLKRDFKDWVDISNEDDFTHMPEWLLTEYIVFGEVPGTSNYFILSLHQDSYGSVFEFEHDGEIFTKRSSSFPEFISQICSMNDELATEVASRMRFIALDTSTNWRVVDFT